MKLSATKIDSTKPATPAPSVAQSLRSFWSDESGQTTTEYVLILAIVLVLISQVRTRLKKTLGEAIDGVDAEMQKNISGG